MIFRRKRKRPSNTLKTRELEMARRAPGLVINAPRKKVNKNETNPCNPNPRHD